MEMKILLIILAAIILISGSCSYGTGGNKTPAEEDAAEQERSTLASENNDQTEKEDESDSSPPLEYILDEFQKRLIQEIDQDYRVLDFDTKQGLIEYLSEVSDPSIAEEYVNQFYEMKDGGLYIIPRDGPMLIDTGKDYTVNKISQSKYQVLQSGANELWGNYAIETTVEKTGGKWRITRIDTSSQ
jgi:hypothetical protein